MLTKASIENARAMTIRTRAVTVPDGDVYELCKADSNRIKLRVTIKINLAPISGEMIALVFKNSNTNIDVFAYTDDEMTAEISLERDGPLTMMEFWMRGSPSVLLVAYVVETLLTHQPVP